MWVIGYSTLLDVSVHQFQNFTSTCGFFSSGIFGILGQSGVKIPWFQGDPLELALSFVILCRACGLRARVVRTFDLQRLGAPMSSTVGWFFLCKISP